MPIVDLRSDTVTRPTPAMRRAMADAEVGDDVLGDDPTVIRLEAVAAERAGKEAALFVPSGTMANLVAICAHTRRGDEVLMYDGGHPFNYEAAGAAVTGGVQIRTLPASRGVLGVGDVVAAIRPPDDHHAPATLLMVEDTSNRGGGTVYPLDRLDALAAAVHDRGLATHMDGARAFNAVVASGVPLARRAAGYDTVAFCFSKGLGAPVGSVLCGPRELVGRARRIRKGLGGGMRQSGLLAAAALHALDHHVERLADDHARARALAEGIVAAGFHVEAAETNMVYLTVDDAPAWQHRLDAEGVRCFSTSPTRLRLVVHLDVDDAGIAHAVATFQHLAG